MKIAKYISDRQKELQKICESHNVETLYAFGSSISQRFNEESSDIDLLVTIDIDDPVERGEHLMLLWEELEGLFNKKIDLLTPASLKNPVLKKSIDKTKILIYDRRGQKVFV